MTETLSQGGDNLASLEEYIEEYDEMNKLMDHTFLPPVNVPGTSMTVHVWALKATIPYFKSKQKVYCFSVYENGVIISPDRDARFKAAYQYYFKQPWVECYFMSLDDISRFLRLCNIFAPN